MRLRSEADVQEFLDAVNQCGGEVYLKSPDQALLMPLVEDLMKNGD